MHSLQKFTTLTEAVNSSAYVAMSAALDRMLDDVGTFENYILALIFLFLGLHFLGVVQIPWTGGGPTGSPRKGVLGTFFGGLLFGVGVGPLR